MTMKPREFEPRLFSALDTARKWFHESLGKEPIKCPVCGHVDSIRPRKITRPSIEALAALYRMTVRRWNAGAVSHTFQHINDICAEASPRPNLARNYGGDFPKLALINLIECAPNTNDKKKTSGLYCITPKGIRFVRGEITIPTHLTIHRKKLLAESDTRQTIDEFWPNFDYSELMS